VLVRLQGMGGALGAQVSLTELLQPYLRKMAVDRLDPRTVGRRAVRTLRSWQRLLADAPATIRPLLQHLKDGTVHVELEIHDADAVADRLTDGLLGSASLLASAQLLSRGTGPRIGAVSVPGAIALAVGVLTWRGLIRGRAGYQSPMIRVQQLIRPVRE
jgi:ubiquinone biosynthesis protein